MLRLRPLFIPALALMASIGCSTTIVDPPGNTAPLRLIHASSGIGAVDLDVGGQAVVRGLAFGQSSPIEMVPSGQQDLLVKAGAQVIGTIRGSLATAHLNTVVVSGGSAQLAAEVVPDTGAASPARANIRFVVVATANAAAPTLIDALLSGTTIGQDSVQRFGGLDAQVAKYWSLLYYDPGQFTVKYVGAGTSNPVLAEATFAVAAGEKKALVLSRAPNGTYHIEVVVEP